MGKGQAKGEPSGRGRHHLVPPVLGCLETPGWSGCPGRGLGCGAAAEQGEAGLPPPPSLGFSPQIWEISLLLWFPGGNIGGRARRWHIHGEHVHPHLQATLQGWRGAVSSPGPSLLPDPVAFPPQLLLPFNISLAVPDVGQGLQHHAEPWQIWGGTGLPCARSPCPPSWHGVVPMCTDTGDPGDPETWGYEVDEGRGGGDTGGSVCWGHQEGAKGCWCPSAAVWRAPPSPPLTTTRLVCPAEVPAPYRLCPCCLGAARTCSMPGLSGFSNGRVSTCSGTSLQPARGMSSQWRSTLRARCSSVCFF